MSQATLARRLCVFGDLVSEGAGWGGVVPVVEAAVAAIGEGWSVTAATRAGADDLEEARQALAGAGAVELDGRIVRAGSTPHRDGPSEVTRDRGGAWPADILGAVLAGADALHVAFTSGGELDEEGLEALRGMLPEAPIFATIGRLADAPPSATSLRGIDGLQVTRETARLLVPDAERAEAAATALLARGPSVVVVLTGGEALIASARGRAEVLRSSGTDRDRSGERPIVHHLPGPRSGEGTAADVWGATFFARLLAGDTLQAAASRAGRAAEGGSRPPGPSPEGSGDIVSDEETQAR